MKRTGVSGEKRRMYIKGWRTPIFPLCLTWLIPKLKCLITIVDFAAPMSLAKQRLCTQAHTGRKQLCGDQELGDEGGQMTITLLTGVEGQISRNKPRKKYYFIILGSCDRASWT